MSLRAGKWFPGYEEYKAKVGRGNVTLVLCISFAWNGNSLVRASVVRTRTDMRSIHNHEIEAKFLIQGHSLLANLHRYG